jgi:hypothetical protein
MKKLFVLVILFAVIASASLCAWEPNDLTKYPSVTKPGDWLINVGVGLGGHMGVLYDYGASFIFVPPMHIAVDTNVPLGAQGLPFFFGGLIGYSGYGSNGNLVPKYYYSTINIAFRFGYHFNWGIDRLDTYAVVKAGWSIYAGDNLPTTFGWPIAGLNIGARYFLTNWFGFWAEAGIGSYYSVDIGLAFKF